MWTLTYEEWLKQKEENYLNNLRANLKEEIPMNVVMLSGYAGSGKDTAFDIIQKHFLFNPFYDVKRFAFADAVKLVAKKMSWDGNKDKKGRKLLQDLGQVGRAYNENVWVNIVANEIKRWGYEDNLAVVTDFRFPNEYEVLKNRFQDVVTIRIQGRKSNLGNNGNDVSEHSLDNYKFDYYIDNSTTLQDFEKRILEVFDRLGF